LISESRAAAAERCSSSISLPAALRACVFASGFHASLAGIDTTTSEPYMIALNFPQIVCFGSRYLILPLFDLPKPQVSK